jgi:hypothetical protein
MEFSSVFALGAGKGGQTRQLQNAGGKCSIERFEAGHAAVTVQFEFQ